jgi:hypothetical protein
MEKNKGFRKSEKDMHEQSSKCQMQMVFSVIALMLAQTGYALFREKCNSLCSHDVVQLRLLVFLYS